MVGPRIPGIGAHHSANPQTDEWLTPRPILAALGEFDLDPCAPHDLPDWTRCARHYTATDDGLSAPWSGSVFMNPPYSQADRWMARLAAHGNGVALVFARTETRWWFESVWPQASAMLFLAGRVTFLRLGDPDDDTLCPTTLLPGDDCPYCDGEECALCDLGPWRQRCDHPVEDRHEGLNPTPTASKSGHNAGGPSVLIAYGEHAAGRLLGCGLPGALVGPAVVG